MPLHGKIVVLKRSGGDGTEFPLTASCMFGRKPDCDIRIQLPQVSKEHCKIDLNENKEVILTNLSSVNPTRVNGEALQQSERLKHGDVITIIDRSFRFEYPPAPTPKKASKRETTAETPKNIQDQHLGDTVAGGTTDKRILEVSTDPHLKDGTNQDNIQRSLEKTMEVDSKEDGSLLQSKTTSPFSDLYQMIKKSLDVKTPRRPSSSKLQLASSRFCTPKPSAVGETGEKAAAVTSGAHETNVETKGTSGVTPKSVKKQRRSSLVRAVDTAGASPSQAPQRFTVDEVIEQVACQTPKSPLRRRSKEATPGKPVVTEEQEDVTTANAAEQKTSPVKRTSTKRKSGELGSDLLTPKKKKKRVSFGGYLSPELFDKKLPPDSPLRRGATPRRSLCLLKPQQSLLRRASAIGLLRVNEEEHPKKSAASPGKKSRSPSPKASSPAKKSPKAKSPSPKATSPRNQTPKAKTPSPRATSPRNQTPKAKTPSPKATSPRNETPKAKSPSPKATSPRNETPKAKMPSPRATSPGKKSPKSRSPSPKTPSVKKETPRGKKRASQSCATPQEHVKTPLNQQAQTPTVQGRFSVSRINTPSPVAEEAATHLVTPKIPLKRKSLKSTTRKTPCLARSAIKAMHRLSGISRASLKVKNSWADIVKFGQTKIQVSAPAKTTVPKRTTKKTLPKPKTPARKQTGHVSTGHADSPVTIVVGRALKQRVVHPAAAAPRVVVSAALVTKNMKMDEDLTGISEMFKTPRNERKRNSGITESDVTKTPVVVVDPSEVDPSVLDTPEETGEMMVSPLSVASAVKGRRYNSEAVKRLLSEVQEPPVAADTSSSDVDTDDPSEQQRADATAVLTPKMKLELPERMTTPRQLDGPADDLRGKLTLTPEQKPEQQECLTGVKRILKTPKQKTEAVEDIRGALLKTPKQKPERHECLTGVKRIMKTPKEKTEAVEDLRGTLLKTPKQKLEQQECLTGVKRIMKTPKQKMDPVEDIRGKLLMTPKQKPEQPECLTGVKRIFEIPKWEDEPVEDLCESPTDVTVDAPEALGKETPDLSEMPHTSAQDGLKDVTKTPRQKAAPVEDMFGIDRLMKTPKEKGEPVEENLGLKRLMRSPRLRGHAPVEDFEGLQELMEVEDQTQAGCVFDPAEDCPRTEPEDALCVQSDDGPSDVVHQEEGDAKDIVVHQLEVTAEHTCGTEEPEENVPEEHVPPQEMEMDTTAADLKKPPRGRKAQVEPKAAEVQQEAAEPSEDAAVSAPVRGRRGKRTEATALPAARQTTRSRKLAERNDAELPQEESAPLKPRRGRPAKKASEPEKDRILPVDEEPAVTAVKPRRGRTARREGDESRAVSEQQDVSREPCEDDITPGDASEMSGGQQDVAPSEGDDSKSPATVENLPAAEVQHPEEPVVPAPVRGRRGRRAATPAPPAVRQTRGRNAKSQAVASDNQADHTVLAEMVEVVQQETAVNNTQEESSAEGAPVKPTRGRKSKRTPDEPSQLEQEKHVSEQDLTPHDEPDQPGATVTKPRRGRKMNPPVDAAEETVACTETSQQPQAPVRARRGRTAPQEEEKPAELQEPVKRVRRTRQAEQDPEEAPVEILVPDAVEVPLEPEKTEDQTTAAAKPRRGRKAKQDAESVTPVEPSVTQEVPAPDVLVDKPKRGRRKQAEVVEAEEKPQGPRGVKTSVESEASQAPPTKRTRRGAAPSSEESKEEPLEPVRKGRRAAAKPTADESTVSTELLDLTEGVKETSQRSVKWKAEIDVRFIPKVTPVRAVRGRKARLEQPDPESNSVSKKASKPEEEKLSDDMVESQPAKRARRGSKVADVKAESTNKSDDVAADQTEPQPKTRRGRSAKK